MIAIKIKSFFTKVDINSACVYASDLQNMRRNAHNHIIVLEIEFQTENQF